MSARSTWLAMQQDDKRKLIIGGIVLIMILAFIWLRNSGSKAVRSQERTKRTEARSAVKSQRLSNKLVKIESKDDHLDQKDRRKDCKSICRLKLFGHAKCMSDCYESYSPA